jgi:hypothetical protein
MREIFERVDDALIGRGFQPLVDWIAQYLLLDCFQQARICTNISAVAWVLSQAGDLTAAARSGLVVLQVLQTALLLVGLGSIMVLLTLFQRVGGAGQGQGRANPLRAGMYMHRFSLLLGLVINIGRSAAGIGSGALLVLVFATAAVYVGSCSNPPPKQREHLGSRWLAVTSR